jgi:hypothetical protein
MLKANGLEPVWKDWDRSFLSGIGNENAGADGTKTR